MPGKLIAFILTLLIIVTFIGFNLDHRSDIRIWFGENGLLKEVPIFVSFFVMYLIGVLSVVPFILGWKLKRKTEEKKVEPQNEKSEEGGKKKVRVLGAGKRRKNKDPDNQPSADADEEEETTEPQNDDEETKGADLS